MSYIKFRLQALKRLSGHYTKSGPRNLATKADQSKAFNVKKIYWGISGALVTAGVAGSFSSTVLLEAEKTISFQDGPRKLTGFTPQSSALQVDQGKLSHENPGIFLWGANECGITAPENVKETPIKLPRKNSFFEGQAFRGVVFGLNHAVAIDANGDLYQWGLGYFEDELEKNLAPEMTLKGKDIIQIAASDKKVFALSRKGELYVLSSAKKYQQLSEEEKVQGWSDYFWGIHPSVKFFKADIPNPSKGEKIKNISAGQHHLAALTSDNRILTLQADAIGKTYGQLGIGNLDSAPIPSNSDENAADYCLQFAEAKLPDSVTLDKVACGNNHTFIRTDSGRIFAFGANFLGQLGMGHFTMSKAVALTPQEITDKFGSTNQQVRPKIVDVVAGGDTSAFVVQQVDFDDNVKSVELYTCGFGQWGQLGNNRYMHVQGMPVKVPSFSYSEELNRVVPVNLYKVSIGATHLFATLDNINVKSDFGRDVYAWYDFVFQPSNFSRGENLDFQLGTGKRNNLNAPAPPLLPNYVNSSGSQESDLQSALQGRLQVASPASVSVVLPGKKGKQNLQVEQEIVAGFGVSAIYSKIIL